MTSKNGADFVHFVMPALAPASQNGQSRDECMDWYGVKDRGKAGGRAWRKTIEINWRLPVSVHQARRPATGRRPQRWPGRPMFFGGRFYDYALVQNITGGRVRVFRRCAAAKASVTYLTPRRWTASLPFLSPSI